MKTTLLSLLLLLAVGAAYADTTRYQKIMLETINELNEAESPDQYQEVINKFERIGAKETDQWEPLYYAGFGYVMLATRSDEAAKKDQYLDLAIERVKKGMELAPQESELAALEGFVHMIRVTVDPANRGQQYAPLSMQAYGKALALNPENPRALYLLGQMEFGTAKFFGSDTSAACEKMAAAVEKFKTYISDNPLAPAWGERSAVTAAERCNQPADSGNGK